MPDHHLIVAGVDVSKHTLDFAIAGQNATPQVAYDPAGLATLVDALTGAGVQLVVLEATGGLERKLVRQLAAAGLDFHIANPRQVRDFARARGQLAKTDAIDARGLLDYGVTLRPAPHALPEENRRKLRDLSARHQQLSDMHTAESNRRGGCEDEAIAAMIDQHLAFIDQQIEDVAQAMDELIDADAAMAHQATVLASTPGIGRLTARRLIAELPELGQRSGRQVAKLVGVAPINRDSGTFRGKRMTGGGRKSVRKMLYMPTLVATRHNPLIRTMYHRLLQAGKSKKTALVACMRKLLTYLNAMIREDKNWKQFTQNA